jgi:hypothetical protein
MNNFDDIINNAPAQEQSNQQLSKEEYATMKRAERDDLFALSDDTASAVTHDGDKFRQFMDVQSQFDRYSAVNTLLILAQKPEASRLGDFNHWKDKGASIKAQEKGISILEPQEYTKEDGTLGVGYNVKKVFDISQVNTQRMKSEPAPRTYTDRQILSALVYKAPMKISSAEMQDSGNGAKTIAETGEIVVSKGLSFNDTFTSLSQELAVAQIKSNPDSRIDPYFSAYCVSYLLSNKHGVDTKNFDFKEVDKVFEYLDVKDKKAEFQMIRDTFADISGRMSKQLESLQKAARNNEAR